MSQEGRMKKEDEKLGVMQKRKEDEKCVEREREERCNEKRKLG
jgi:hypothetical protein